MDTDRDGFVDQREAIEMARRQDDMEPQETINLINVADQVSWSLLLEMGMCVFTIIEKYGNFPFRTNPGGWTRSSWPISYA